MTQEQKRVMTILIPLLGSHVTGEMLSDAVDKIIDIKPSENNSPNMASKEVMFDFLRWLIEADRFNGGQSLKKVFNEFTNYEKQNK